MMPMYVSRPQARGPGSPRVAGRLAAAVAIAVLMPTSVFAGGFELPDHSAVAGATGGAGAARRGDPSSAWYTPAEVADGRGFRGGVGLLLAIPSITAEAIETPYDSATTEGALSTPPHLHLSYAHRQWAVGLYAGISHGSTVNWPEGWWGRFESTLTGVIGIRVAPFFALRLGGEGGLFSGFPDIRLSVGAHGDIFRSESGRALDFLDEEGRVHLLLWGYGFGGDASIFYQATEALAFSFTYKSRTAIDLAGDADFTVPDAFVGRAMDQHATSSLVVPDRFLFGAAWQQELFGVFLEVDLTLWSVRERTEVDFDNDDTSDIDRPASWHDSVEVRLGGEYSPLSLLHLRLGGFWDMDVGPEDTLSAASPDMNRIGVSAGVGVDITPIFGVDAYYTFAAFLERVSSGPDAALTRYSGSLHIVGLTLRVVVDPTGRRPSPSPPAEDAAGREEGEADDAS